jgi:hypothetical protein
MHKIVLHWVSPFLIIMIKSNWNFQKSTNEIRYLIHDSQSGGAEAISFRFRQSMPLPKPRTDSENEIGKNDAMHTQYFPKKTLCFRI